MLAPYTALEAPGTLYVSGLAVEVAWRGRGLGSALMDRAVARARREGLRALSLICFKANARARALYRRRGFRVVGKRAVVPHPMLAVRGGDALLMVAPIPPEEERGPDAPPRPS